LTHAHCAGLLLKFDGSHNDEKSKVGSLTILMHLLNLPTKTLGYRLEEIVKALHSNLGKYQVQSAH
jgi:hypothetical protein